MSDNSLQKFSDGVDRDLTPSASTFAKLKPLEKKLVEMEASCVFDPSDIQQRLGLSSREYSNMLRRSHVKEILEWKKKELSISSLEEQKSQRKLLIQKTYAEVLERFDDIDEDDLPLNEKERLMVLQTRAKNVSFDKILKGLIDLSKLDADLTDDQTRDEHILVRKVRAQHTRRKIREKKEREAFDKYGLTEDDLFNQTAIDGDGNMKVSSLDDVLGRLQAERQASEFEIEEEISEFEITTEMRKKDE